jgi:opacity protein-like surface antigen
MRIVIFILLCVLSIPYAHAADDDRQLAFSLGGFSGSDTSGIAIGFYSLRPKSIGWYINGTISSRVDDDEDDFRPIPGDIRVDSDTDSVTLNVGLTYTVGPVAPYVGAGIAEVSEYGLYRTASDAFWYEENDETEANLNIGLLISLRENLGLDLGANSANKEWVLGLAWRF